jgi:hypothetical protein
MKEFDPSRAVEIYDLPLNLEVDGYCDYCMINLHASDKWRVFSTDSGLFIFHERCYNTLVERWKMQSSEPG